MYRLPFSVFTRYQGRGLLSHMLPACGLWGKTLLAALLGGLLLYLAGHPLPREGQCWKLLFLASVLYALFKSLGVLVRSRHQTHKLLCVFLFIYVLCLSFPLQHKHRARALRTESDVFPLKGPASVLSYIIF